MKNKIKAIFSKKKYVIGISVFAVLILIATSIIVTAAVMEKENNHFDSSLKLSESKDIPDNQESVELHKLTNLTDDDIKLIASKISTGNITKVTINEEDENVFFTVKMIDGNNEVEMIIDAGNGKLLHLERDRYEKDEGDNDENKNE